MGGTFPLSEVNRGRIWNSSFWETVYKFFIDYKKMSGWIFTITGWLFSHTVATQLCSNTLYKWFLHNRSLKLQANAVKSSGMFYFVCLIYIYMEACFHYGIKQF